MCCAGSIAMYRVTVGLLKGFMTDAVSSERAKNQSKKGMQTSNGNPLKRSERLLTAPRSLPTNYVELHARSAFSFLKGASTPEELISTCAELKMPSMALLDQDGLYGAARFHLAGKKLGVKAHIGAEIAVQSLISKVQNPIQIQQTLDSRVMSIPVLVQNRTGYQNLCRLITLMKLRVPKHAKPGECAVTPDELAEHAEGLICLTGGSDGPLGKNFHRRDAESAETAQRAAEWL